MVPITPEEKASPLYRYFARDMVAPDPSRYTAVEQPMDPALMLAAPDMNRLFDAGYLPGEVGYCRFPDGTATLANLTPMPGVTPEMFDFWFAWHGCEPMRYKIWNHDQHYHCQTLNPEQAMDKRLSLRERLWNTTHDIQEDVGMGKEHIVIQFRDPRDIGFDPEKLAAFPGTIVCSGSENSPTIMCHFLRPVPGGCELRTRFWMGWGVREGKPFRMLPPGVEFPLEPVHALLTHNIKEFTNLAAILPEVYAEFSRDFAE